MSKAHRHGKYSYSIYTANLHYWVNWKKGKVTVQKRHSISPAYKLDICEDNMSCCLKFLRKHLGNDEYMDIEKHIFEEFT